VLVCTHTLCLKRRCVTDVDIMISQKGSLIDNTVTIHRYDVLLLPFWHMLLQVRFVGEHLQ
jgi:hypothetical protein